MYDRKKIGAVIYQGHVQMFDRKFPFSGRGNEDHYQSKDQALEAARQYGAERLNALAAKKGRPLTMREELSGELEARTDHRPLAERVRAEAMVMRQNEVTDDNPYRSRIADLESQRPLGRDERDGVRRRIAQLKAVADEWDANKAKRDALDQYNRDPHVVFMREHSNNALKIALFDKGITADELRERQELFHLAKDGKIEPKEYEARADAADERMWARQDAEKARLNATMAETAAEHAGSRQALAELGESNG
jgi:hypothetical protein